MSLLCHAITQWKHDTEVTLLHRQAYCSTTISQLRSDVKQLLDESPDLLPLVLILLCPCLSRPNRLRLQLCESNSRDHLFVT